MSNENKSMFDGFETDEVTGEVIIPRATVGVATDISGEGTADNVPSSDGEYIPAGGETEELPELSFDFDFGEEEFADTSAGDADEEMILQSIDEALAAQMAITLGPVEGETKAERTTQKKKSVWKRIPTWCKATMISMLTICRFLGFWSERNRDVR